METNQNFGSSDEEEEEGNHGTAATPQQIQILQSLLPNSTNKTDARSILEDASNYLKRIHQEMEQTEKELSKSSEDDGSSSGRPSTLTSPAPKILRVETEKLIEGRFVVKIISKKGPGVAAQVQRVFESLELDVKMTSISVQDKTPCHEMLTTALVQVRKVMPMTEEDLHELIMNGMEMLGLVQ